MASRMIGRRTKLNNFVQSALVTYLALMVGKLEELLQPHLKEGETMPDFRLVLVLFRRHLAYIREKLNAAEDALRNERDDDAAARDERDAAQAALFELHFRIRETLTNSHGPRSLEGFGFESATETEPNRLLAQVRRAQGILQDPEVELPKPLSKNIEFNREGLAEELAEANKRLSQALDRIDLETREADQALIEKNRTTAEHDPDYLWITRIVEALLRLIGETELADRIRPSQTRLLTAEVDDGDFDVPPEPAETPEPTETPEPAEPAESAESTEPVETQPETPASTP